MVTLPPMPPAIPRVKGKLLGGIPGSQNRLFACDPIASAHPTIATNITAIIIFIHDSNQRYDPNQTSAKAINAWKPPHVCRETIGQIEWAASPEATIRPPETTTDQINK